MIMIETMRTLSISIAALILGFIFLIKGADFFVDGSAGIAKKLKISSIVIGLTVVAMGTSLPETAVSVIASVSGNNALSISNAVGSNIFNFMVVLGTSAIVMPIAVQKESLRRDFPISIACALLLLILGFTSMTLSRIDGFIFMILFVLYIVFIVRSAIVGRKQNEDTEEEEQKETTIPKCLLLIVIGVAGIGFGADWVVDGATVVASYLGMSQTLIGLTIVSMGTSLPELVTSVVAARKKEVGLAVGNAVGSNVFNILMVLGIASGISPLALVRENLIDIIVLVAFSLLVWVLAGWKKKLSRKDGLLMVLLYACYMVYIIMR